MDALVTKDVRPSTRRQYLVSLRPFFGLDTETLAVADLNDRRSTAGTGRSRQCPGAGCPRSRCRRWQVLAGVRRPDSEQRPWEYRRPRLGFSE
jgi:hypothetical protein